MIAAFFLMLMAIYLLCGLIFALPFAFLGVRKIDPHAAHGTWGFRVLIIPGAILLWPLLARRWSTGVPKPPEERNAHRLNAECGMPIAEYSPHQDRVSSSCMTCCASPDLEPPSQAESAPPAPRSALRTSL